MTGKTSAHPLHSSPRPTISHLTPTNCECPAPVCACEVRVAIGVCARSINMCGVLPVAEPSKQSRAPSRVMTNDDICLRFSRKSACFLCYQMDGPSEPRRKPPGTSRHGARPAVQGGRCHHFDDPVRGAGFPGSDERIGICADNAQGRRIIPSGRERQRTGITCILSARPGPAIGTVSAFTLRDRHLKTAAFVRGGVGRRVRSLAEPQHREESQRP